MNYTFKNTSPYLSGHNLKIARTSAVSATHINIINLFFCYTGASFAAANAGKGGNAAGCAEIIVSEEEQLTRG